jgi:drug/metabolite transporter (DMT)-like permease
VLLLIAAALHAIANALMKQAQDKLAFAWWMLGVFCILGLPSWFWISSNVSPVGWLLVCISGLLEAVYFLTLTRAYTKGDLSLVYPIARGSAPLFLLLWAVVFLGERPSVFGLLGILLIVIGLYLINLPSWSHWNNPLHGFKSSASRWALVTGVLISAYTAVDKMGVRYFAPLIYLYFVLLVTWFALTPQWFSAERRLAMLQEVRAKNRLVAIFAGATLGTVAYTLVLAAMRISPVSYVGPVREVSVVIGAWIGVRFMAEQGGGLRIAASAIVATGIALIALRG